tara:strand:- start:915 stop:1859 length:945 start_codon:yes stop_codon:yes gene_type:complete
MPSSKKKRVQQKPEENQYPFISILTPLYNRNKFLPLMLENIKTFDYPKEKLEWFILDSKDGDEDVKLIPDQDAYEALRRSIHPIKLKYEYINRKMTIAEKRTYLSKKMTYPYFANMDSDDIYMECFLKYSLDLIKKNKAGMCGSPEMIFVWPHLNYRVTAIKCEAKRQAHEATFFGTKKYVRSMNYYTKNDEKGEGASLIDHNENNFVSSECCLQMICVCHNTNTCNKDAFEEINIQDANITGPKKEILEFIMNEEIESGKENKSAFTIPDQGVKPSELKSERDFKDKKLDEQYQDQLNPPKYQKASFKDFLSA